MIKTYTKRNQYNGFTHDIDFTPFLFLRLTELDSNTINVELIEKKLFRKTIHLAFVSHEPLINTVITAFGKLMFTRNLKVEFDFSKLNSFEDKVLEFMNDYRSEIERTSIVKFSK